MLKSILDADILSEYLKGHDQTVVGHAIRYLEEHGVFTFTSVTLYEIVYGLELKRSAPTKRVIEWLNKNEEITPTSADYRTAARVKACREKKWLRG